MDITIQIKEGTRLELAVKGRLDAYWADSLSQSLEEAVHSGARDVRVDMAELTYISSMGIRVLVEYFQKLSAIEGSFAIARPSPQVERILAMTGLLEELLHPPVHAPHTAQLRMARADRRAAEYTFTTLEGTSGFRCRTVGDPAGVAKASYQARDCRQLLFPETTVAVGLGAFGNGFDDTRKRFGEFLALSGFAAYQPTDGSNVADYIGSTDELVPEVQVLYALVCEGGFSHHLRFSAKDPKGSIGLTELLTDSLALAGAKAAAVVIVAESSGLLGAWLRHSPAADSEETPSPASGIYEVPTVRKWLSFTPDRLHPRALTVVAGVVSAAGAESMADFLRPMGDLQGHLHAAAFSYQPLRTGPLDVHETARSVFTTEKLNGVLHLLRDDRGSSGAGESEFVRGAVWIGPITEVIRDLGSDGVSQAASSVHQGGAKV